LTLIGQRINGLVLGLEDYNGWRSVPPLALPQRVIVSIQQRLVKKRFVWRALAQGRRTTLAQQSDGLFPLVSFLRHFEDQNSFKSIHSACNSVIGSGQ
jgi:hypothetical protein